MVFLSWLQDGIRALAAVAHLVGHGAMHWKGAGLIPSQGVLGSIPW